MKAPAAAQLGALDLIPCAELTAPTSEALRHHDLVGAKAAGLASIPTPWTPPFFVLPTAFYRLWQTASDREFGERCLKFTSTIDTLLSELSVRALFGVIVRSSATDETLLERGAYRIRA